MALVFDVEKPLQRVRLRLRLIRHTQHRRLERFETVEPLGKFVSVMGPLQMFRARFETVILGTPEDCLKRLRGVFPQQRPCGEKVRHECLRTRMRSNPFGRNLAFMRIWGKNQAQ